MATVQAHRRQNRRKTGPARVHSRVAFV